MACPVQTEPDLQHPHLRVKQSSHSEKLPPPHFTFLSRELLRCSWAREMMMWHFGSAGWWFESSEGSSSPWKINLLKDRFVVNSLRDIPLKCCRLVPAEGVCIINLVSSGTLLCLDEVRTPQSTQNYPLSISLYLYKITLHFPNYFSLSLIPVFSLLKIEFLMFVLHYIGEKLKEVLLENFFFWVD